jgi:type IX secretion system PorP/SprF family membrane protein
MQLTRTIKFFFTILGLCVLQKMNAQDLHFSQFFEAPLLRNPSLAGIYTGDIRVQGVYRSQWTSITNAYKTASINAEYKMPVGKGDDFFTAGLQVLYDRSGDAALTTTHVLPALNYHKSLSNQHNRYLSLGFMGGWVQRKIDISKVTTNSQYDGLGLGENFPPAYSYLDGSVGMTFNSSLNESQSNNFYIGVAYHHFNRPKNSFYKNAYELYPKWVSSAGFRFGVGETTFLTLQADYTTQGTYSELIGGGLIGFKLGPDYDNPDYVFHVGTFLRWDDALIPVIKIDKRPLSFAFSYDANISKLKPSTYGRGGFELSLTYIGLLDRDNSSINSVLCPRF